EFATRTTYNPKTNKHFAFFTAFIPAVISYRKGMWDGVGAKPDSWADVLAGGRRIKLLNRKPVGFSLAPETNSGWTMRSIMYSFGASEQDTDGNPSLKSKETLDALRYVKTLYDQAMTKDVLSWDAASNNRFMLNDEGCLTLDTISIPRASEEMHLAIASDIR